jgi:mannose-1-phosphate guanylyltransferase
MVLAAGLGTRLRPLTEKIPKPLLEVSGKPIIHYPLELLKRHGITEVVINTHHLADLMRKALGDGERLGLKITWSHEPEILGTGGGVKKAEDFFQRKTFVVINADTIIDIDLDQVIEHHRKKRASATMVLKQIPDVEKYGSVEVTQEPGGVNDMRVRRIRGEPKAKFWGRTLPMVFTGVHVLEPDILAEIPPGQYASIIRHGYIPLIQKDRFVAGYIFDRMWMAVDTREKMEQAEKILAGQKSG